MKGLLLLTTLLFFQLNLKAQKMNSLDSVKSTLCKHPFEIININIEDTTLSALNWINKQDSIELKKVFIIPFDSFGEIKFNWDETFQFSYIFSHGVDYDNPDTESQIVYVKEVEYGKWSLEDDTIKITLPYGENSIRFLYIESNNRIHLIKE